MNPAEQPLRCRGAQKEEEVTVPFPSIPQLLSDTRNDSLPSINLVTSIHPSEENLLFPRARDCVGAPHNGQARDDSHIPDSRSRGSETANRDVGEHTTVHNDKCNEEKSRAHGRSQCGGMVQTG